MSKHHDGSLVLLWHNTSAASSLWILFYFLTSCPSNVPSHIPRWWSSVHRRVAKSWKNLCLSWGPPNKQDNLQVPWPYWFGPKVITFFHLTREFFLVDIKNVWQISHFMDVAMGLPWLCMSLQLFSCASWLFAKLSTMMDIVFEHSIYSMLNGLKVQINLKECIVRCLDEEMIEMGQHKGIFYQMNLS